MDEKQTRVGIYARISEDRDGQQTATARQMADARAFAERKGWGVVEIFEDIDLSAFQLKTKRPEFERMLKALREGEVEGIVVWKFDRLTRQQRDLARVMEACEPHKAFVASVTEPIDTRETYGQFVAELLVAQARMESANTSARQRRKAQEQREQGLPPTNGRRCFGYDRRYTTVVTEEAAIVREVRGPAVRGGEPAERLPQPRSAWRGGDERERVAAADPQASPRVADNSRAAREGRHAVPGHLAGHH